MCGILFSNRQKENKEKFKAALDLLDHRGPDNQSMIVEDMNYFGHTRLSIQDIYSRSNQPFYSKSGKLILIYNGEIYNSDELIKKHNLVLRTKSDTEVVIELYEKMGPKFLLEIEGMFAIIIYNIESNRLFYARDRLGIKPLYIYRDKLGVILSSEISSILELTNDYELGEIGLRQYKYLRTFFREHTIYKNIKSVEPGTYSMDNVTRKYWELNDNHKSKIEIDELDFLLSETVKRHLISDVPVGTFLSGGIDSTYIALKSNVQNSWCIGGPNKNEFMQAESNARLLNINHQNIEVSDEDFVNELRMLVSKRKEPVSVPNEVYISYACKTIVKTNKVVLSGEGADELFAGYNRIFEWSSQVEYFDIQQFAKLYSYGSIGDLEILEYSLEPFMKWEIPYLIVSSFMQISHLQGLLKRLDNATMQYGVEARVPYVDHKLVEELFGYPYFKKNVGGKSKGMLKSILEKYVLPEIANRDKIGFPVDVNSIFKHMNLPVFENDYDTWLNFNLELMGINE
jgi:asparagine synthase (glutamine-hydrolysing)